MTFGYQPLLSTHKSSFYYGNQVGCHEISLEIVSGQFLAVVGESGSGKSTLLKMLAGEIEPSSGQITFQSDSYGKVDLTQLPEVRRRQLRRKEIGLVTQRPSDGLRMHISVGGNVAERVLVNGVRHYGQARELARHWLQKLELDLERMDELPTRFSIGMQQRVQIAKVLASSPRLLLLDEPTSGLDVSVQARLLDVLQQIVREQNLAVILVTHDLAVARMMSDSMVVMQNGRVEESGLTDQVLDDPQHAYTQLLTSSILPA